MNHVAEDDESMCEHMKEEDYDIYSREVPGGEMEVFAISRKDGSAMKKKGSMKCFNCGGPHMARSCPKPDKRKEGGGVAGGKSETRLQPNR